MVAGGGGGGGDERWEGEVDWLPGREEAYHERNTAQLVHVWAGQDKR